MRIGPREMEAAILGGAVLGGGGGGSMEAGRALARAAADAGCPELVPVGALSPDALVATAALVGAPGDARARVETDDYVRACRLLAGMMRQPIAGLVSCENGGTATANGWLQAVRLGVPVIDAPADGRAHPTSAMGALGLDREEGFESLQAAVGGCRDAGRHIEMQVRSPLAVANSLVRAASEAAGGLVAVARNPVPASRLLEHAAIGAISRAIAIGAALERALPSGLAAVSDALGASLGARLVGCGTLDRLERRCEGGFDVGYARVAGLELTIWNEYMTLERDGSRIATFPDLIVTLAAGTLLPVTSGRTGRRNRPGRVHGPGLRAGAGLRCEARRQSRGHRAGHRPADSSLSGVTMLKQILDAVALVDTADANGQAVSDWLRALGADADTIRLEGRGHTDLVRAVVAGSRGRAAGGSAPTLGIIGRLGGVGARPDRLGLVSDGDGAIVALAAAAWLARAASHGDRLAGDVLIRTHISPASPMVPHEPAPFIDSPVDRDLLARAEVDAAMDAILSIDATRANRIAKRSGFAITGTVKEGYILRPTPPMLDICERVAGRPPVVLPLFTQDITPAGNGLHHVNSIMQPAVVSDAPVIGVALLSPVVIGGVATGVLHEPELAQAASFAVEVAKEFSSGALPFYFQEELDALVHRYGSLRHLQRGGRAEATS